MQYLGVITHFQKLMQFKVQISKLLVVFFVLLTEVIPFNNVAVVTANHTGALGTFPSITIVNTNNIVLFGEVRYITTTQITVTFASPQTGTLYLN